MKLIMIWYPLRFYHLSKWKVEVGGGVVLKNEWRAANKKITKDTKDVIVS